MKAEYHKSTAGKSRITLGKSQLNDLIEVFEGSTRSVEEMRTFDVAIDFNEMFHHVPRAL